MRKKNLVVALLLFLAGSSAYSQFSLQFAINRQDDSENRYIPRFSWRVPFEFPVTQEIRAGLVVKNNGIILDRSGNRHKMRAIAIAPQLGVSFGVKSLSLNLAGGVDYNFHYKEKFFPDKKRKDKEKLYREWFSERVNKFNPYLRMSVRKRHSNFSIFGEYLFNDFMNREFTETINAVTFKPYEHVNPLRFNLGIAFRSF